MSKYKEINTESLINEMISLNLNVPPELAQEIALREDAIIYLKRILQDDKYWYQGGPGDAWAPIHTIHILSLIKTKDALELLLAIMRDEKDALGDWITESMPTLLAAFGEDAIERLKEYILDERDNVDWIFNLPDEEQSYSNFMKNPLDHFSKENIDYLRKISYPETKIMKKKEKIGRNAPCPCGSGKKYKKCCLMKGK